MEKKQSWDWNTDLKEIPVGEWKARFNWVEELNISPDGENIASVVNVDEAAFKICVNGHVGDTEYEKIWSLKSLPDNGFAAFVCADEEWTLIVNGQEWSSWFDFIWDLHITPDGKHMGFAFQKEGEYGMAIDGLPWNRVYSNMAGMTLSNTGTSAAVVQVVPMKAADVDGFKQGLFSVAVNGNTFHNTFLNIWDISFDRAGQNLAAGIRLDREAYTIVKNDVIWDRKFQGVWKPIFSNSGNVLAPVRDAGKWKLFMDNEPFWKKGYDQLWKITPSPANNDVATIVANHFGKWSVAVNDKVWKMTCDTMISDILYSDNGSCLVAVLKDKGLWNLAVNQTPWNLSADKVFTPCISPDGYLVAVVVEKKGKFHLVVNNKIIAGNYDLMTTPVFSPDQSKILIKGVEKGVYKRRVISI
ncbi:MAG: Tmc redox complex protein TmcD [Proteobacteria bacterium]|nr:Tmc redox complex protein TmcD [Desulfobacula sp.]MBU3954353.1 Tmc redox complex protein TmcD [Pseudomonadota bacterium]MBU4133228.1 Tmc redox complex protein TmcD [Pseudomonadota bacterium]